MAQIHCVILESASTAASHINILGFFPPVPTALKGFISNAFRLSDIS